MIKKNQRLTRINGELYDLLTEWQKKANIRGINLYNTDVQKIAAEYLKSIDFNINVYMIPKSKDREVKFIFKRKKKHEF